MRNYLINNFQVQKENDQSLELITIEFQPVSGAVVASVALNWMASSFRREFQVIFGRSKGSNNL